MLHDIGKVFTNYLSDHVPEIITEARRIASSHTHAIVGAIVLKNAGFPSEIVAAVAHHHDRSKKMIFGKLISRYLPTSKEVKGKIYQESVTIWYDSGKSYSFVVISEGSEINAIDNGQVIFVDNDLNHKVPIFFRPLIVITD